MGEAGDMPSDAGDRGGGPEQGVLASPPWEGAGTALCVCMGISCAVTVRRHPVAGDRSKKAENLYFLLVYASTYIKNCPCSSS